MNKIGLIVILLARVANAGSSESPALYQISLNTISEMPTTLNTYRNHVLLIVNTASQCGYTPQYAGLEKLFENYRSKGLIVLGFPSNDYGQQEPGTNREIKFFCQGTYHVNFPMFEKNPVSGKYIQPLFSNLIGQTADHSAVEWNFEKFLVGRDGKLIKRFRSGTEPESPDLTLAIETALGSK